MLINPPDGHGTDIADRPMLHIAAQRSPTIIILINSKCHVDESLNTPLMRKILITLPAAVPQKGYTCFPIRDVRVYTLLDYFEAGRTCVL